jgi:pyridoxal phosphate enzyme (YggS family)
MATSADIADNLAAVRRRIGASAARANRDPSSITLIAVSKTFTAAVVQSAVDAGQRHFGENRVQEGLQKIETLAALGLDWHLIGHLQSNKARKAVTAFSWIHSVDSLDLLRKVDAAAADAAVRPQVLIQVDLAQEATKFGAEREAIADLVKAGLDARAVELRGLMIVPPIPENPEESRPWFRQLRELRDALVAAGAPRERLAELSMGMSQDFEVAVEEGATMVRVGSAVFGSRPAPA